MQDPTDDDIKNQTRDRDDGDDDSDDDSPNGDTIANVPEVDETLPDESQFEEPVASPAVTGEENVFSKDAPEGEPADIDEELQKVGITPQNHDDESWFLILVLNLLKLYIAPVAQRIEYSASNGGVGGSIPSRGADCNIITK